MTFNVEVERENDGRWIAEVTDLPGALAYGTTREEAVTRAEALALRIMADRLCSEYPFMPSDQLLTEGRSWLRRVVAFQGQRLTLNQHREILTLAGWIALLIACVEYDSGDRQAAVRDTGRPGESR